MSIGTFDTTTLIGVLDHQQADPFFFLTFFNREITFDTEEIMFDEVADDRRMAPFVSPNVAGRVMAELGSDTKTFKPAYLKPMHAIDPNQQFSRRPGEAIGTGSLTPNQRYDAAMARNLAKEKNMNERRFNWMAAQAMIEGAVTVDGDDYPRTTVDFGRDATLSTVLTGTARWGESAANPLADLRAKQARARRLSGGRITDIIMGEEAYDRFYADAEVKELLKTDFRTGSSSADAGVLDGRENDGDAELKAVLAGGNNSSRLRIWTYAGYFHERAEDGTITEGQYIDPNAVVGVGNKMDGVQAFGAIRDKRASLRPIRNFPKIIDNQQDPPVEYTQTQSAPLMIPVEPNNTFKIQAHDPA